MLRQETPLRASTNIYRAFITVGALFAVLLLSATPGRADGVCVKSVTTDLTLNGVVASGAGGGCPVGPVWQSVGPVEYLPGGASPSAYMYLAFRTGTNRLFIGIDLKGDPDLSNQDIVILAFDANNNDVFDNGDFLIKVPIWNAGPIATGNTGGLAGADCNKVTGPVEVRRFTGGAWGSWAVDATVQTELAYDYETAIDAEHDIWNLEISLPVNSSFPLQTTGSFFGIGSYIFMDIGHFDGVSNPQTGTIVRWPSTMVTRTDITDQNIVGVTPTTADQLGNASLTDNCFDVNWTAPNPWVINGGTAASGDHRIDRTGNNLFHVTFFFDGPGTTDTPLTNNGTVRLSLHPYGPGAVSGWDKTLAVDAARFNHAKSVDFNFDFSNPPASFGNVPNIDFVCASTTLENFQRDDVVGPASNLLYVNYNYFTTSDYPMDMFIFGKDVPNLKPGESTTVQLRLESANDPAGARSTTVVGGFFSPPVQAVFCNRLALIIALILLAIGLILLLLALKQTPPTKLKLFALLLILLAIVVLILHFYCKRSQPSGGGPVIGTERWEVKNADEIGLKPVKGEPDLYEMPIKYEEAKRIQVLFTGMQLPYKTTKQTFSPVGQSGANNVLRLPVKPGQVVSLISFGQIDLDGPNGPLPPVSPTGMVVPATAAGKNPAAGPYLLSEGYYSPNEQAGALIGSFDNFETSFVLGRSASIQVPANAGELSVSVNAQRGTFAAITGNYEINWIVTEAPSSPTHTNIVGDGTIRAPRYFNNWDVLTSLNVYSYYTTRAVSADGRTRSQTRNIWGSAHMSVYDSHVAGGAGR
jgi:hypothetical protein